MNADRNYYLIGPESTGFGFGGRRLSPFLGRDVELRLLLERLDRAGGGLGQVIWITGEPGVGKSRLLFEFRQRVSMLGVSCLEGRCASHGVAVPYYLLHDLLRNAWQLSDDPADILPAVRQRLAELALDDTEAAVVLALWLGADVERPASLNPEGLRPRIFAILRDIVLKTAGSAGCVLLLEDLHWIDHGSDEFLAELENHVSASRVFVVLSARSGHQIRTSDRSFVSRLALPPLSRDESATLARALLPADSPQELLSHIVRQAEGNPFFLEELSWAASDPTSGSVPDTVKTALMWRMDRLEAGQQRVLGAAAVLGCDVPLGILSAMMAAEADLPGALDALVRLEFLCLRPGSVYGFKHALTQEVAYSRLSASDREALHLAAGRAFETLAPARLHDLAHHALRAQSWERAHTYLYASAVRARQASDFFEVALLLEQALDALQKLPSSPQRDRKAFQTSSELWTAYYESGQFTRIREVERQLEALERGLGEESHLAALLLLRAQRLWGRPEPLEVINTVPEVLRLATPTDLRTRGYAYFLAGSAYRDVGALSEAAEFLEAGARLLGGVEPDHHDAPAVLPILVNIHAWRSEVYAILGLYADAGTAARQGVALARMIESDSALIFADSFLGYALLLQGELAQALPVLEQAFARLPRGQYANATFFAVSFLALALALDGERPRALELLNEHYSSLFRTGLPTQRTRYLTAPTTAYLAAGKLEDARALLDIMMPIARKVQARGHLPTLLRLRAEMLLNSSSVDLEEAESLCHEAHEMALSARLAPEAAHCLGLLGRAHIRAGKTESGRRHVAEARALFRSLRMEYWARQLDKDANDA